jgi:hypothetical protein
MIGPLAEIIVSLKVPRVDHALREPLPLVGELT